MCDSMCEFSEMCHSTIEFVCGVELVCLWRALICMIRIDDTIDVTDGTTYDTRQNAFYTTECVLHDTMRTTVTDATTNDSWHNAYYT